MPSTCKQIGFALSQATIEATLAAQPHIARMLVELFQLRLHPSEHDDAAAAEQVHAIEQALDRVSNLNEDRVLRQLLALIQATLRTNLWRTGVGHSGAAGPRRSFLSFKFDSAQVPGLPSPRPLYEIFVYSPRFEGIHLRGGKVARGGLRWSDRPEDFRTEVLGLVKAQMVKNTVIVPVGSKGGFVLKKAPPASDREAYLKEGVACYQDYLRGLLDLTDNLVAGQVRAAAAGAPHRRRRPLPGGGGRQGHGHLLRLRQRRLGRIRPLAGRRLRLRRQRRLRPQGDGHHRARRLGKRQAPLPRAGRRHAEPATSPWSASATCRATCSATACCCRGTSGCWRPSTTATSSSTRTRMRRRRSPSASGCSSCRARRGPTTTRS